MRGGGKLFSESAAPGCGAKTVGAQLVAGSSLVSWLDTALLTAHLVCVNAAAGGPLVAAWLDWRSARDAAAGVAARFLAAWSVGGLVAGVGIGLLLGWLRWNAEYQALWLGPMSYKLQWAAIELLFSLVLTIGWWLWLRARPGGSAAARLARGLVAVLAATNLLYHFPLLFAVAQQLYESGRTGGAPIRGAEFRALMLTGPAAALAVHVTLASLAVAGIMLLGLALRLLRGGDEAGKRIAVWGGRWALAASLAQLPVGLWTLAALPAAAQTQIMGGDLAGTLLLVAALCAAFWLISDLVQIALGEAGRPLLIRAMAAMLVTVALMTAMQERSRPSQADAGARSLAK
jgi:hypothetical protein